MDGVMRKMKRLVAIFLFLVLSVGAAGAAERIVQLKVPGCFS
jgi:hypothetical protein